MPITTQLQGNSLSCMIWCNKLLLTICEHIKSHCTNRWLVKKTLISQLNDLIQSLHRVAHKKVRRVTKIKQSDIFGNDYPRWLQYRSVAVIKPQGQSLLPFHCVRRLWQQRFYALLCFTKYCWFYTLLLSGFCSLLVRCNSLPDYIETGLRWSPVISIFGRF